MSRKNISEILSDKNIDIKKETKKIADLLENNKFMTHVNFYSGQKKLTLLNFLEQTRIFLNWKYRKTALSIKELMNDIGVDDLLNTSDININTNQIIMYLEFAANMIFLFKKNYYLHEPFGYSYDKDILSALLENITYILDYLNLQDIAKNDDIHILVEKNSAAISAAEVVEDKNLSFDILEYNHYLLKGDIDKKRKILKSLADKLESDREKLKELNNTLEDDLFFLFNNIKIRHDNDENQKLIDKIGREKLEFWYDETYQMALLAILLLDNKKRHQTIKELKALHEKKIKLNL